MNTKFINDVGTVIDQFTIQKQIAVNVKVMLEGAYDQTTGLMRDDLRTNGLVPAAQPYTGLYPFVAEGGNETISPAVLAVTGNNAIVDWILVELRDANTPTTVLRTRVGLLQRDGDIVDVDGVSPLRFKMDPGNYQVAVRHRNHLGIMTASPVTIGTTATSVDLTLASTVAYGTEARKNVNGVMTMWTGDAVLDGIVKYTGASNDRDPILVRIGGTTPNNTAPGYYPEDLNLDGSAKYTGTSNDRDPILVNVGSTTPNGVRVQQLP
jgi:hypothetical protein